jgi:hypothetical protein
VVAIVDIRKNNNAPNTAPFQCWYALIKPELHEGAFKGLLGGTRKSGRVPRTQARKREKAVDGLKCNSKREGD